MKSSWLFVLFCHLVICSLRFLLLISIEICWFAGVYKTGLADTKILQAKNMIWKNFCRPSFTLRELAQPTFIWFTFWYSENVCRWFSPSNDSKLTLFRWSVGSIFCQLLPGGCCCKISFNFIVIAFYTGTKVIFNCIHI